MNCLKCGNPIKRCYEWNSLWQWKCSDCGFGWDSEQEEHVMLYLDNTGECEVHTDVPFGTLAIFKDDKI